MSIPAGNGMFNGYRSTKRPPQWAMNAFVALVVMPLCLVAPIIFIFTTQGEQK